MQSIMQDARLAWRGFRKAPVFTCVAVLTLTLAIGANTAIFSLLNALVLRDLPVRDPSTLVQLATITPATSDGGFSLPMFRAIVDRQQSMSAVIGWLSNAVINVEVDRERIQGAVSGVTGNYFSELGIRPALGRLLTDDDVDMRTLSSTPVAVIGHGFWRRHFNGDPNAVGRTVRVEGVPFTIVGITPEGFNGFGLTFEMDVVLPLSYQPTIRDIPAEMFRNGLTSSIRITGRLRPEASIDQARAELATVWPGVLAQTVPPRYSGALRDRFMSMRVDVRSAAKGFEPALRQRYTQPLTLVMMIAMLVVLIACVNIASLMMSRVSSRMHDMGVRLALGAGRWRVAQQLFVEGVLLSLVGALFGVLVAGWGSDALVGVILRDYLRPVSLNVSPDSRVIVFTTLLAMLVGVLFSVAPAWRAARGSSLAAMQQSARTTTRSGRTGRVLVAVQVGLSLVLLTNSGLLVRSLQEIRAVDSGMNADDVFVVYSSAKPGGYQGVNNDTYYPSVIERLAALPGVQEVSISLFKPAGGGSGPLERVARAAEASAPDAGVGTVRTPVAPGFFDALGVRLLTGRDFDWRDNSQTQRVMIVSETLATHLFGDRPALGQRVGIGVRPENQDVEIIGVVADARLYDLKDRNLSAAYVPALQDPDPNGKCFVFRGQNVSMPAVTAAIEALGVESVSSMQTLDYITDRALLKEGVMAALATFFGVLTLLMAGVGLYGLASYQVSERRREIGIRIALGADPRGVITRIVRDGVQLTAAGVMCGAVGALAAAQLLRSLLYGVSTYDAVTLVVAPALLLLTTIAACLAPAARAARVDPMITLRAE